MQLIVRTAPGEWEINFMWLPAWLALNPRIHAEVSSRVADALPPGTVMDQAAFDKAEDVIVAYLEESFPAITGMREYLDGLKFVEVRDGG